MWEFFPSRGPQVWEPHVCEKKEYGLFCILGPFRNIFGFYKKVTFFVALWLVEVGIDDTPPHPLREKFPL